MKSSTIKLIKLSISFFFFYKILNFFRNYFLKPVFFDIFVCPERGSVCIIAPYYSFSGLVKSVCVISFVGRDIVVKPEIIDDPDKNCLIILFKIPDVVTGNFYYKIKTGRKVIFSDSYSKASIKIEKKYKLSITTLFKYKTEYLDEWIKHHIKVGVQHFYLYENNIKPELKVSKILTPYIQRGIVTHILWPVPYVMYNHKFRKFWPNDSYLYAQVTQINHALYKYANDTEYLLSCDTDEFFYSPKHDHITDVLDLYKNNVSSIRIEGFWFGAVDDEIKKMEKFGVLNTFKYSSLYPNTNSKCIYSTNQTTLAGVHCLIKGDSQEIDIRPEDLRFNHYWALSWRKRTDLKNNTREVENTGILSTRSY